MGIKNTPLPSFPQRRESRRNSTKFAGFTLVELIVVITILVILGTIAFISLGGFSGSARDSSRVSDSANISKGLSIYYVKNGSYPDPTTWTGITYSGSVVWKQGTVWDSVIWSLHNVWVKISKKPTDPLSNNEYVYSTTTETREYSIKTDYEGDRVGLNNEAWVPVFASAGEAIQVKQPISFFSSLAQKVENLTWIATLRSRWQGVTLQANAATGNPQISYIAGNYNGVAARVTAGTTTKVVYLIAVPNIVTTSTYTGVMVGTGQSFITNGSSNSGGILFTPKILYSSWALPSNDAERVAFASGIINAYSGTVLASNSTVSQMIANANNTGALASAGGNLVSTAFGGTASVAVTTASISNQPSVTCTGASVTTSYSSTPGASWCKFGYTGADQSLVVTGTGIFSVKLWGAWGWGNNGTGASIVTNVMWGGGWFLSGSLTIANSSLSVMVWQGWSVRSVNTLGGNTYGWGGACYVGGNGWGRSALRSGSTDVVTAGGGGGAGWDGSSNVAPSGRPHSFGGFGWALIAWGGGGGSSYGGGGGNTNTSAGWAIGSNGNGTETAGVQYQWGVGTNANSLTQMEGGGGGGGYYWWGGGGGGPGDWRNGGWWWGGSSYAGAMISPIHLQGWQGIAGGNTDPDYPTWVGTSGTGATGWNGFVIIRW